MGLTVVAPKFKLQITLDFGHQSGGGEQDWAQTTVTAPWVTSKTVLTPSFSATGTVDHDSGDFFYENLSLHIENILAGASFDVLGYAPLNTWGRYLVNIIGE